MSDYPKYLASTDVFYPSVLKTINKKKGNPLQPLFEAFTNSFEAITEKSKGKIDVCFYFVKDLIPEDCDLADLIKITIFDNGIGFNDIQLDRLKMFRDSRKGPSNKGTGRIQFIHYFEETKISSIYEDTSSGTGYRKREITLSQLPIFLNNNSIIRIDNEEEVEAKKTETFVTFYNPLEKYDGNFYSRFEINNLKEEFIRHYLALFCENTKSFPKITFKYIIGDKTKNSVAIEPSEIPIPNKTIPITMKYSKVIENKVNYIDKSEIFELKAFKLGTDKIKKNEIKIVSKGEIAKGLAFDGLLPNEEIDGQRFLFLLSGKYIDEKDSDTRGEIKFLDNKEFLKQFEGYLDSDNPNFSWNDIKDEEILLSDIETITNTEILKNYPEIETIRNEKSNKIEELRAMFLLNPKAISTSKITVNDSYEDILTKVYREEARLIAQKDNIFREHFQKIIALTPGKKNYQNELSIAVSDFVGDIPASDQISLSKYVARRRLVLEVFDNILSNEEKKVQLGGRIDEKVLHNLIFQQSSKNPEESDLWLIGDDFIYFKGVSEIRLSELEFDGKKIIKDENLLTTEQISIKKSFGENRLDKKPDILLFPNEGKCIIIEFKPPDVNASSYVIQIDNYASLIRNFSVDDINIDKFYGYLIGESFIDFDIRSKFPAFEYSEHFDYWFRTPAKVPGFFGKSDGASYFEIIKYSTLLQRAKIRNKIFMKKLGVDIDYDN